MNATPGPWFAQPMQNHGTVVRAIAQVAWCGANSRAGVDGEQSISSIEAAANARLISAAPDLIDALQCAVIKLARYREQHGDKHMIGGVAAEYDAALVTARAAIRKATEAQS